MTVRVQPRASREAIQVENDGRIRIAITAAPMDGEANTALCRLVAKAFGLPKRCVSVAHGAHSRDKIVRLEGTTLPEVRQKLSTF
ncbi:MAG: hypothetical protein AMXMBFR84_46650 [Candidatus Hydrogenedentota bacterium]